ncbi:MAG: ABC transporter permease [Spirochaetaceae bacterium]
MKSFTALFRARTLEFVRDRGTFFWNMFFPMILVFGFALAFSDAETTVFTVGLIGETEESLDFLSIEQIDFIPYDLGNGETLESVVERVRRHELDMVIDLSAFHYYLNTESETSPLLRRVFEDSLARDGNENSFTERQTSGQPIRYVDWVIPGVIGMNMLFSCLFGVGFVLVRYRKNGVLKRLKATPVSAFSFVSAQAASRLAIVFLTSLFVYIGTNAILNFTMEGSYVILILLTLLAIICMISIGLLFASRLRSEELAGGIMNLVSFPMIIGSGVFFSLESAPEPLRLASRFLPLTHFVDGARAVMIEGAGLTEVLPNLMVLVLFSAAFMTASAAVFRWD